MQNFMQHGLCWTITLTNRYEGKSRDIRHGVRYVFKEDFFVFVFKFILSATPTREVAKKQTKQTKGKRLRFLGLDSHVGPCYGLSP